MKSLPTSQSNIFLLPDPLIKEHLPYTEEYIYYPIYQYTEILQEYFENKLIGLDNQETLKIWENFKQIHQLDFSLTLTSDIPKFIFVE